MTEYRYTVSVSANSGSSRSASRTSWRVRCFGTEIGNWNALGRTVAEQTFNSRTRAVAYAKELAATWRAEIQGIEA